MSSDKVTFTSKLCNNVIVIKFWTTGPNKENIVDISEPH